MRILGVHGGSKLEHEDDHEGFAYHDAAAVLLEDGELVTAIEEERLSRLKHSNCFPVRAIRHCLETAGCSLDEIEAIATNSSVFHADLWAKMRIVDDPTNRLGADGRSQLGALFEAAFGVDVRDRISFCNHHLAHAWSAYVASGFERSLILSIDGDGDGCSGMVLVGEGRRITKLQELPIEQSLGNLYQRLIKIVGYDRFDEYKVMGLAPYGDPTVFLPLFERCYRLLPGGAYHVEPIMTWFAHLDAAGLIAGSRRRGEPFTQTHKDFAAALQRTLETIVLHVLTHFRQHTGQENLCLVGGVAHNCSMNGRVLDSGLFARTFVQPAAHDAGGALGAAYSVWFERDPTARPRLLDHLSLGTDLGGDDEIRRRLEPWSAFVTYERQPDVTATTARLLAEGRVVGWAQGRSEFGPRALGNRSILADPRPAENKARINQMVKKREGYRPFAPAVLEERAAELFEVPEGETAFPFMIFVLRVREHARSLLGAITHVDGTARLQTVSRPGNPRFWQLIHEFDRLTGVPVLLNTSFNNHAEPIVDSVDDAVGCFLTTGLDDLAVGDYLVSKRSADEIRRAMGDLVPCLPPFKKLVKRRRDAAAGRGREGGESYEIASAKSRFFGPTAVEISPAMFGVLSRADGHSRFADLAARAEVAAHDLPALLDELAELWSRRLVWVHPLGAAADRRTEPGTAVRVSAGDRQSDPAAMERTAERT